MRSLRTLNVFTALLFLVFLVLMGSLIENYINNESKPFDSIVTLVVTVLFHTGWQYWMEIFGAFASRGVLLAIIVLTFLWTVFKGQDRKIELSFLFFLVVGGELYEEGIRRLFHSLHPVHAPFGKSCIISIPERTDVNGICHFGFLCLSFCSSFSQGASANCCFFLLIIVLFLIGLIVCTR
ncbi:hypothetical protein [Bacillus subtilis]|uniref:hypothetical protein n=1 Tax=Bacillus subtilis TaxID=1423 RepID=UPI00301A3E4D